MLINLDRKKAGLYKSPFNPPFSKGERSATTPFRRGKFFSNLLFLISTTFLLTSCGFHLQSELPLAPSLHQLYFESPDPYDTLAHSLKSSLELSHVRFASSPKQAQTILVILRTEDTQELLSVNSTQQTRQYNLHVIVDFQITDKHGKVIVPVQSLTETRTITVESNQILASSNTAFALYQDMRRAIALAIMNRLASHEITRIVNQAAVS